MEVVAHPHSVPPPRPPVERVIGGLWSIPVPIPNNPLGHTNVYAY